MAALPYMQLYVADYLADTSHLTTTEHGAYLLLMFNYWQRGQSFKAKDEQSLNKRLATVARMSVDEWTGVADSLREFFNTSSTEWRHERIERDLNAVHAKSSKASAAGKASAARRKSKNPPNEPTDVATDVEQPLQQSSNHTDTDTDTDLKNTLSHAGADFEDADAPDEPPKVAPFAMHLEWAPDERSLTARAKMAGLPIAAFAKEAIAGFIIHHEAKGLLKTNSEWLAMLVNWVKRDSVTNARVVPISRSRSSVPADDVNDTTWANDMGPL